MATSSAAGEAVSDRLRRTSSFQTGEVQLELRRGKFSEDGKDRLRKALPNVVIGF